MLALHSREDKGCVGLANEGSIGNGAKGKVRTKVGSGRVGEGNGGGKGRNGGELEHFCYKLGGPLVLVVNECG